MLSGSLKFIENGTVLKRTYLLPINVA